MLSHWWESLSGESRAAIIAALIASVVGPTVTELFGWRARMIRWFHIRTLEKLAVADQELAFVRSLSEIIDISKFSHSIEELAKQAGIPVWRAKVAIRWRDRIKEFGSI